MYSVRTWQGTSTVYTTITSKYSTGTKHGYIYGCRCRLLRITSMLYQYQTKVPGICSSSLSPPCGWLYRNVQVWMVVLIRIYLQSLAFCPVFPSILAFFSADDTMNGQFGRSDYRNRIDLIFRLSTSHRTRFSSIYSSFACFQDKSQGLREEGPRVMSRFRKGNRGCLSRIVVGSFFLDNIIKAIIMLRFVIYHHCHKILDVWLVRNGPYWLPAVVFLFGYCCWRRVSPFPRPTPLRQQPTASGLLLSTACNLQCIIEPLVFVTSISGILRCCKPVINSLY